MFLSKKGGVLVILIAFGFGVMFFKKQVKVAIAVDPPQTSCKKGYAGNGDLFNQLGASWRYNHGLNNPSASNVPMAAALNYCGKKNKDQGNCSRNFKDSKADGSGEFDKFLETIERNINNLNYKDGYWLIGNEPDLGASTDTDGFKTYEDAVYVYGVLMNEILKKDPSAKFIILGLSTPNQDYAQNFITNWDAVWDHCPTTNKFGDPCEKLDTFSNLLRSGTIKGWHIHNYADWYDGGSINDYITHYINRTWYGKITSWLAKQREWEEQADLPRGSTETWVTEFGSLKEKLNNPQKTNPQDFNKVMTAQINLLEQDPEINRYAWYHHGATWLNSRSWANWSMLLFDYRSGAPVINPSGTRFAALPTHPTCAPITPSPTPIPTIPPQPSGDMIKVYAARNPANRPDGSPKGNPVMKITINEIEEYTWNQITSGNPFTRQFAEYNYQPHFPIDVNTSIKISFADEIGGEADLIVDKISINGQNYETEDSSVLSTGTYTAPNGCAPGYKQSKWLHCPGFFQYDLSIHPNIPPMGNLESADCSRFSGWAGDANNPNQPVTVHFYKDGPWPTGTIIGSAKAETIRETGVCQKLEGQNCDVCPTDQPQCKHGFTFNVPVSVKDGQEHSIYVHGINTGLSGDNPLLTWGVPRTINCPPPATPSDQVNLPDLNHDGQINELDLGAATQLYGPNTQNTQAADINNDGKTNGVDLAIFITGF